MAISSMDVLNTQRDLQGVLDYLITNDPKFIKLFPEKGVATQRKHEWFEDHVRPKKTAYSSATNVGVFTVASSAGWDIGDVCHIDGDTAVLRVTAKTGTSITTEYLSANGSSYTSSTLPTAAGTLCYDTHPMAENSTNGPEFYRQSGTEYNVSQIYRIDIDLSRTGQGIKSYSNENSIAVQEMYALQEITKQLNSAAIFGTRIDRSSSFPGMAGGLRFYGNQVGSLSVNCNGNALDAILFNDAAQTIIGEGGSPDTILCGTDVARLISNMNSRRFGLVTDPSRGSFVSQITCDITGTPINVFVEPRLANTECWVCDSSGFGLIPFVNGKLKSWDATLPNQDGKVQSILGEFTFEFKNAKSRICKVYGFENPGTTIARGGDAIKVYVSNPSDIGSPTQLIEPVLTATKKDDDEITLAWAANSNASRYEVRYATSTAGIPAAAVQSIAHNAAGTVISGLTASTAYYFQVRSVGDGTNFTTSDWSATATATTDAAG